MSIVVEPRMTRTAVRILDTAERLFYAHGLRAVGLERIAEEAETTKKTIYDRFGSKDGLITAYLRQRRDRWRAFASAYLEDQHPEPGPQRVVGLLDALEVWMADAGRGCGFVNAHAELAGTGHEALPLIAEDKSWTRGLYAALVAEIGARDPERLGHEIALVHEGAVVQLTAGADPAAADVARGLVRRMLAAAT